MKNLLSLALALALAPAYAGVWGGDVTQSNIHSTVCKLGWTKTVRPPVQYTNMVKRMLVVNESQARVCMLREALVSGTEAERWAGAAFICEQQLRSADKYLKPAQRARVKQNELDHQNPLNAGGHPWHISNLMLQPWSCKQQAKLAPGYTCIGKVADSAPVKDGKERKLNRRICKTPGTTLAGEQHAWDKGWKVY